MAKFVSFEETAKALGVTAEKLNEMRERGEIHAYRDGGTWKFRDTEIERVQRDRDDTGGSGISGFESFGLDEDTELAVAGGSGVSGPVSRMGSEINLDDPTGDASTLLDGSGKPAGSSVGGGAKSDIGSMFDEPEEFTLESNVTKHEPARPAAAKSPAKSDVLGSGIDLAEDEFALSTPGAGSQIDLTDDDDLVLGTGSDVTRNAESSGIGLAKPTDSGLALDEPVELGGSSVDDFALGEESGVVAEPKAGGDSATQLAAEDDFLLTPLTAAEDEEDSGSQVIALDEDEESPFAAAGGGGVELDEDEEAAGELQPAMAGAGAMAYEAPYTVWNVVALAACTLLLLLVGMCMYDLVRNMWGWDQNLAMNNAIMDKVAEWLGYK